MCSFRPDLIAQKTAERLKKLEQRKARIEELWASRSSLSREKHRAPSRKGEKEAEGNVDDDDDEGDLVAQLKRLAKDLLAEGEFKDAALMADRAHKLVIDERRSPLEVAECLALQALTLKETAQYDRALALYEEIIEIATSADAKDKVAEFLMYKVRLFFSFFLFCAKACFFLLLG